ncbi:twin-arginine translocase TatA/TatE family subunit [Campylobacter fetus]|uniref:Sec-independent protein translocase protein TatA n=1 Tax=Campylobacter fetus subsp. testudinum TaxID=1507806 RepID=A0AAX0HD20_CAMFE|nr:twin-arginine translocase TatA/TatE family subunit [Campylobacter fetus]AGZ82245.1 twin arginine translocation system, TatA/E family protein [Campylobacter fetus subsp. testudinum 03-427]AJB45973.1 preprotein translocase subunit TatA [Campylobacter fetus subsp. testudinum]ALV65414.1 twin arginine translocation system, TatA/E family protein [Campylobacter fetus subsp. testudinum Sp3]AVK81658.1 twin-arginine translocase TatA/TatE family subunit [Campylobacter fetus subsp. testudinum]EAI432211
MGSFSMGHWLIVLAIIVLLFGAKKIPELAKGVGKGIKTFKKEMEDETPVEKIEKTDSETQSTKQNETTKNV